MIDLISNWKDYRNVIRSDSEHSAKLIALVTYLPRRASIMLRKFVCLSYFYFVCFFIVTLLSVTAESNNSTRHLQSTHVTRETSFINAATIKRNLTISDTRKIRRAWNTTKFYNKSESFGGKIKNVSEKKSNERKYDKLKSTGREDIYIKRKKLGDLLKEQTAKFRKKVRVSKDSQRETTVSNQDEHRNQNFEVSCEKSFFNETLMSLRNLFRLPRLKKATDCSNRREVVDGSQQKLSHRQSSASSHRFSDRDHAELINQYERDQSLDEIAGEYVHPEGHNLAVDYRKPDIKKSSLDSNSRKLQNRFPVKNFFQRHNFYKPPNSIENHENYGDSEGNDTSYRAIDNKAGMKLDKKDLSSRHKRDDADGIKSRNERKNRAAIDPKLFSKIINKKNIRHSRAEVTKISGKAMQNSTSQDLMEFRNTPWPLVPGPISCDLDFQLQPSFVAKLGEFDYVVSVQLQRNPEEPADHACTGVIYNPRFIVIAPHCLHDNYGVTVTSTDDLCTIDEMIEVDYIIEHEGYDAETRKHDIALIKLKSEIHKKSARFPKDDGALGRHFYAVGFGELMWRSFPKKISKLLQKLPVRRYPRVMKEAPGLLHITTSHMDLTGAFRGDFGGALINPRGEFVGLKSKLVKKSTEYEVYTRVRSYLPWIQSMVTLHGS